MKRILVLFLCGFLLTACEEEKSINQLVVGTSADYPPFEFYQDGEVIGLEMDLMRKIVKELQKELIVKDLPFESLIGALQTKRIDLVMAAMTPTPERLERADFSIPYHHSYGVMLVAKDSPIKSIDDLAGKTVGVQLGSSHEKTVQTDWIPKIKDLKMRSLSKVPDLLQDFKAGRLDAIVMGSFEAFNIEKTAPYLKTIILKGTESVSAIAFPKGSPLLEPVNKLLQKWTDDGTLAKLEERWIPR